MHPVIATTPTQYAFAICLLIVAPVLAIFAASAQRSRGENVWKGGLLVGGASWAGWIVSGAVAAMMVSEYPGSGSPSEVIAIWFVLPGLLSGGAALRWVVTHKPIVQPSSRGQRLALGGTVVVATLAAILLVRAHVRMTTWPGRRELPDHSQVTEEQVFSDDFLGDFEYVLRARMSESSFREWMRRLDVQPTEEPGRYGVPHDYSEHPCGSQGDYRDGVGAFHAWCS